jgi:hypothetical protein
VLRLRMNEGVRQALVQWEGLSPSSASWEDLEQFQERYPAFQPEDELLLQGGVMLCGPKSTAGAREKIQPSRLLISAVARFG